MRGPAAMMLALVAGSAAACEAPPWDEVAMAGSLVQSSAPLDPRPGPVAAWFEDPTDRYDHAILGDGIEAGTLAAQLDDFPNCIVGRVTLSADFVFEDLAPRLADLDGDGHSEVIVVRTEMTRGAQLAVYGLTDDGLDLGLVATTPPIGQTRRWLAPVAIADLDDDGLVEIAYVDRPHLARILRIWRFVPDGQGGGALVEVAAMEGFTNHRIGEDFISGGLRRCGNVYDMILATPDWSRIRSVTFLDGVLSVQDLGPWSSQRVQLLLDGCPAPPL